MGPPQLIPRISSKAPEPINFFSRYSGRRLGHDVSTLLYRFVKKKRTGVDLVRAMEDGALNTYVANSLVDYGARLRRNGVVGVFVLDGAPLPAKYSTRELRDQARQEGVRLLEEELAKPEGYVCNCTWCSHFFL